MEVAPEEQNGFRPRRSTVDGSFTVNMILRKRREYNMETWAPLIDLVKAFDTIPHRALFAVLRRYGVPDHCLNIIIRLQDRAKLTVEIAGEDSNIDITIGVRQGSCEGPILFLFYMNAALETLEWPASIGRPTFAFDRTAGPTGVSSRRTVCHLYEVWHSLFADDCGVFFENRADLVLGSQVLFDHLKEIGELMAGLTVWDDTDGCGKQYRCGTAMYLLSVLASTYGIVIDRAIGAPGHGKDIVDGLNATHHAVRTALAIDTSDGASLLEGLPLWRRVSASLCSDGYAIVDGALGGGVASALARVAREELLPHMQPGRVGGGRDAAEVRTDVLWRHRRGVGGPVLDQQTPSVAALHALFDAVQLGLNHALDTQSDSDASCAAAPSDDAPTAATGGGGGRTRREREREREREVDRWMDR